MTCYSYPNYVYGGLQGDLMGVLRTVPPIQGEIESLSLHVVVFEI
jgi:hypothetical protein